MAKPKLKICFVLTTELAVKAFLQNHLRALSHFYDITVIVNTDNANFLEDLGIQAKLIPMKIARAVNLVSDTRCLIQLIEIFKRQRFLAVHSITPKAGLLAMLASWLVRIPLRIHTFTGQVWVTKTGFKRFFLKKIDCLIANLTSHNIVDSPSQRQFLISEKVISDTKSVVFAKGSISGVDVNRFQPNLLAREKVRQELGINVDTILFIYLGRLNRDKGVLDLARAFTRLKNKPAHLLFVGPDEANMRDEIMRVYGTDSSNMQFVGHTNTPEHYMAAADVLCLPSYREGFGSVVIEAAATGVPAVVSNIYGLTDAVVNGVTGLLHKPGNSYEIEHCMAQMMENSLRTKLGSQAKDRAIKEFNSEIITQAWVDFYRENISKYD